MKSNFYRTIQAIEHSQDDFILLMKKIESKDESYIVYIKFNGKKDIRRYDTYSKAFNFFEIMQDIYYMNFIDQGINSEQELIF